MDSYTDFEQKILEAKNFIAEHSKNSLVAVLFSGGKDSLVSLHLVKKTCKDVIAIHADTTIGIPDNLNYVKEVCNKLGVRLHLARPYQDYSTLVERCGFPRPRYRWCCSLLKIQPIGEVIKELKSNGHNIVVADGIRAEESKVRKGFERSSIHKIWKVPVIHPIFYWNKNDVEKYIEFYLKPLGIDINPLYKKGFRRAAECWCPVFKGEKDFIMLANHYPDLFIKLVQIEKKAKSGFSYAYIQSKPFYLSELAKKLNIKIEKS
jgi:phosphoadenosine phosphosulfate reductase